MKYANAENTVVNGDGWSKLASTLTSEELALVEPYVKSTEEIAYKSQQLADSRARDSAKTETVIQYLINHTPAECDAYIHTKVTDLATATNILGKMAMALCVLSKDKLR